MSDGYKVGYGKPPEDTRFEPGKSGNPKGRPKGSRNFATDLKEVLGMRVEITSAGHKTSISTQKAALMRLRERALKGDHRALEKLLTLAVAHAPAEDIQAEKPELGAEDRAILDRALRRQTDAPPRGGSK
ncbi:DUF5681 domain-containing protein [Henriciella sp.]|uniref:DUF5681 domain-containing protein n=1 Tax=Henriciella sp. TaxID=1968823 RepID=UPI00260D7C81|nr:DUF5681 domain-containing protein [Henriciella sp.]